MTEPLEFAITVYPEPGLRKPAEPVAAFDAELARIVEAMFERMTRSNGVGLAAPQVGLRKRILVLNPTGEAQDALTLVNPTIVSRSGPETTYDEGCLSFPGIYAEVRRPERCHVKAFDVRGGTIDEEFGGFVARIIQHEYDHLEGVLLVDRMSPADKQRHRAALEALVDSYKRKQSAAAARR